MRRKSALSAAIAIAIIPTALAVGQGTSSATEPAPVAVTAPGTPATTPTPPRRDPKRVYRSDSPFRFGTVNYSKWYARQFMYKRYGWKTNQYRALERLWTYESGWQHRNMNGSSGAYGIPQALPGSKMSSAGRDWARNPETQIRWGLGYIRARYGTPANAYGFFRSHSWY